ncbi:hypothetical protein ACHQM5_022427 [Ranunculus cassubicifolius]
MGCSSSRLEKCEALRLCKERKRFVKEAIDSRYSFTAAHLSYIESLKTIGVALRRYAEAEVLIGESPLPNLENQSPSHSSYPSPSPSHNAELGESPLPNQSPYSPHSPVSPLPHESGINYMKSNAISAVTVKLEPVMSRFGEDDSFDFPLPPPPPPEIGSSWDFFDTRDETKGAKFVEECGGDDIGENYVESLRLGSEQRGAKISDISAARRDAMMSKGLSSTLDCSEKFEDAEQTALVDEHINSVSSAVALTGEAVLGESRSKMERAGAEREDPSEFITHRAKDFLSSIKDIEHRFFRASESGREVSRMLEANKIKLRCSEAKGRSSAAVFLTAFHQACCLGDTVIPNDPPQPALKAITWHRSVSSRSSSSKNPLAAAPRDDVSDSGSDFVDEFCMITGSHSSTLDRLYAWELKLYDEVKASEFIRKSYDYWCAQLRHQFAKDANTQVIDKTRSIIKDLHSQMRVALHAVDSIAKRIEKLRDEELLPQLIELIQGLIRMWKVMLECHHAQYITISLAYHTKTSSATTTNKESQNQVISHLQHEIECFESSFRDWIEAHRSYIESLNGWLQICIILPQENSRGRRVFSPRRSLAPPIFVLCRDWSTGIKTLPSSELIDAINVFITDLNPSKDLGHNGEEGENKENDDLSNIHTSLTKVLDRLTKFAEALRKMYEDIRQGTETAQVAFTNYKTGAARHFGRDHL